MARSKKRVEQVAEKSLQHINLGGGDRNLFRPIVHDDVIRLIGLCRNRIISLRRTNAIAIFITNKKVFSRRAKLNHSGKMAANARDSNGLILRHNAKRAPDKKKKLSLAKAYKTSSVLVAQVNGESLTGLEN